MKIVKTKVLAAGNIFGPPSVVQLELAEEGELPALLPPSTAQRLLDAIPPQREGMLDFPAWKMLENEQQSVSATLAVEALALLVQRLCNWPVSFSGSGRGIPTPAGTAVFEIKSATAGPRAGRVAVDLLNTLMKMDSTFLKETFFQDMRTYLNKTISSTPSFDALSIAKCASERNIPWTTLSGCTYLWLGQGRRGKIVLGSETTNTSSVGTKLASTKPVATAIFAAAGLPVPKQRTVLNVADAMLSARSFGFPVVVKPANGKMGRGVSVGLIDDAQVSEAFSRAQRVSRRVVVESLIPGNEHRLLVINGQFRAAALRRPAQVKGDGKSTVRQLIDWENQRPERSAGLHSRMSILLPILIDEAALVLLTEQGLSLDAVPDAGKVVFLRRVSNVSQGGDTIDVTDLVHPSIRKVAERAATMIGVDVCGVDFITTDISRPYWETNGAICEVNSRPGLSLHLVVSEGTPRDVADDVVRMLYPEGACSRIPVVAVLSETAEHEVLNAIHAAAANSGRNIGLIWPKSSSKASQSRPGLAQHHLDQMTSVILDRTLDAAIVVVSAQDIVRSGLGFDQIDLAVVPAEGRSGLTQRACELLTRVANRRVITENDPRVIAQVLEVLKGPQGGHHETSAGLGKHSARPVATKPVSIERLEESDTSDFTVLLVGDIGFGESYWQHPRAATLQPLLTTKGYQYSLKGLMGVLKGADLTIGNLEVPLASATDPGLEGRKRYLGWSNADETVAALREAGLDAVSLANNHALDCGEAGLRETIHRLEQAGIAVFGAGINSKAAGYPFVRTVAVGPVERTIVVFGCFEYRKRYGKQYNWYSDAEHPGINPITPEEIAEQISNLRETKPNPFFIVYPHWGVDYQGITNGQRACAEQLMAAGADLIIGHGAHTLQGIETVAGRPAVYGLGNFVWNTPGRYSKLNALPYGLAAAVRFRHQQDGVSVYLRLYPLLTDNSITNFQNRPVSAAQFSEVLGATQNFDASNNNVVTGLDRRGRYIEVLVNTSTNCAARNPDRLPTATALAG